MMDSARLKSVGALLAGLLPFWSLQCSNSEGAPDQGAAGAAGTKEVEMAGDAPGGTSGNGGAGFVGAGGVQASGAGAPGAGTSNGGNDGNTNAGVAGAIDDNGGVSGGSVAGAGGAPISCGGGKGFTPSNTATLLASDFSSGDLAPYRVCTTQGPNYGSQSSLSGEACAKFFWTQTGYNGTRDRRGAEACSDLPFYKEGWYGFLVYLPSPGFPRDKTQGIGQVFSLGGCSSWAAMLQVRNNELWFEHRGDCASPAQYQVRLAADIERNVWLPIIIHFVASHAGAGSVEVWFGQAVCTPGSPSYRKLGINFGFGDWTGDALSKTPSNEIGLKFGMYNFDDAAYTPGETRTIYYDNVSQLAGNAANAFELVKPTR